MAILMMKSSPRTNQVLLPTLVSAAPSLYWSSRSVDSYDSMCICGSDFLLIEPGTTVKTAVYYLGAWVID